MKFALTCVLSGLILAGCATTRPQMQESQYFGFAKAWYSVGWCGHKGWMDPATAAMGKAQVSTAIHSYSYDENRMAHEGKSPVIARALTEMTEGDCRDMAVSIQARKQQIDRHNAQADQQQQAIQNMINTTRPTQTFCNRIGTQVLCNSM